MAKKIKFALEMANGFKVRKGLEELREHFDLHKATEHFIEGTLAEWLEDRYYDKEATKIRVLDKDAPDFSARLCEILGVPYEQEAEIDVENVERLNEKKAILAQRTSDAEIIANAGITAFTQEDLADLLDNDEPVIYLCGDSFSIPVRVENRKYVGVLGMPKIDIEAGSHEELDEKGIVFENVALPDALCEADVELSEDDEAENDDSTNNDLEKQLSEVERLIDSFENRKGWPNISPIFDIRGSYFSQEKSVIKGNVVDAANCFEEKIREMFDGRVEDNINSLAALQKDYDEQWNRSGKPYLAVSPSLEKVCERINKFHDEKQRELGKLAGQLVDYANYEEEETGFFETSKYSLLNRDFLADSADKYFDSFAARYRMVLDDLYILPYLRDMLAKLESLQDD